MDWSHIFLKSNFSVDQCLSGYTQKSDLEALTRSLKNYGQDLQVQMTDILKNETEAIVNLAEYLTSLNSKIEDLFVPISQLREEIRTLFDLIETAEESYKQILTDLKYINSTKNHIYLKLGIIKCSLYIDSLIKSFESEENLLLLEHIVNKYSFQQIYMEELNLVTPDLADLVNNVEKKLIGIINTRFLQAFESGDKATIKQYLKMYANLRKHNAAHKIFQDKIVRPVLKPLFTENYLEKCNYDIDQIYNEVLNFLNTKTDILTGILRENPELTEFNFVLNSFWFEFHKQSCEGLPHITAPGNPELFQKRFTSTCKLLEKISEKCGNKNLIKQDEMFQDHLKRFNLPVYFEIIFQQIAGNFESDLYHLNLNNILAAENENSFKLSITVFLWDSLLQCFDYGIYLDPLADQFIRLSMMLISRYVRCIEFLVNNDTVLNSNLETYIMYSLVDLNILLGKIAPECNSVTDIDKTIYRIMNKRMQHAILKLFRIQRKVLTHTKQILKNTLIRIKLQQTSGHLQHVVALPRLYRRTNRQPPREASVYVIQCIIPIFEFREKFKSAIPEELIEILDFIITKLTEQYLNLVREVLESVCKMEESLKRLKSRNVNHSEETVSQQETMSDEQKIRQQIKYDVCFFCERLYPLGSTNAQKAMESLKSETF